jgi:hypothetical protein
MKKPRALLPEALFSLYPAIRPLTMRARLDFGYC